LFVLFFDIIYIFLFYIDSRVYKLVEEIVCATRLVKDVGQLSSGRQTYSLEVFHNVVNHFAPKMNHHFYWAMKCRYVIKV
jgi:hypothetical protein